mmetsp:Transcript_12373/g.51810  ORF Transcript_12373/g.51810 Transcript_12373/m.51810 type:complete len:292 (-) Transcript_12373:2457-3332(-)
MWNRSFAAAYSMAINMALSVWNDSIIETMNGWRDTDRMILLSCTTCAVSLISRIFTLSITFTATGTYRAGASFGSEATELSGTRRQALYTLPVRPTPSCLANTYASRGEGARGFASEAASEAASDVFLEETSRLFRNSSSDMPIAAAVGAYGGAEVVTDDCDDSDVRDGDGDPAAFFVFASTPSASSFFPPAGPPREELLSSFSDRDRDAMSITECAFLSAAVFDSPKLPSFFGSFPALLRERRKRRFCALLFLLQLPRIRLLFRRVNRVARVAYVQHGAYARHLGLTLPR